MNPRFDWYWDRERSRYIIRRNGQTYQEVIPNRHSPAHGRRYIERCVRILNGDESGNE